LNFLGIGQGCVLPDAMERDDQINGEKEEKCELGQKTKDQPPDQAYLDAG